MGGWMGGWSKSHFKDFFKQSTRMIETRFRNVVATGNETGI